MEGLYRSCKNKGESWDQLCPWAPLRSLLQRRAGSGHSICGVEKCLILELAPCEWREHGHAVGLGSLSLSLGRGAVSEAALVGTSVLLAGWCGWSGFHPDFTHSRISEARLQWESGCWPASRTCTSSQPDPQNWRERSQGSFLLSPSMAAVPALVGSEMRQHPLHIPVCHSLPLAGYLSGAGICPVAFGAETMLSSPSSAAFGP